MPMTIEQIIDEIQTLSPEEQDQLRARLVQGAVRTGATDNQSSEDEFKRRLFAAGILKEIKRPVRDQEAFNDYQPIRIQGKPISETMAL